jgi:hypothetical protein
MLQDGHGTVTGRLQDGHGSLSKTDRVLYKRMSTIV